MVQTVTVRMIGGELGFTFPKGMLERLNLGVGDKLFVVEVEGGILLAPYDPAAAEAMEVYRRGAEKYGNALRELAGQ